MATMYLKLLLYAMVLNFYTNNFVESSSCEFKCDCKDRLNVTCSLSQLSDLPKDLPSEVRILSIKNNKLQSLSGLESYPFVIELDVRFNEISSISADNFIRGMRLEYANLEGNRMTVLDVALWSRMSELIELNLGNNDIGEVDMGTLSGWPGSNKLTELLLPGNRLKTIKFSYLRGLTNLKVLDLSRNKISNISNSAFSTLKSLEELKLEYNRLEKLDNKIFKNLINLKILDLSGNNIEEIGAGMFIGNKNLRILYLSNMPKLKRISGDAFVGLENLQELYLHGNDLSFLHADLFKPLKSIRSISLQKNNLSTLYYETFQPVINSLQFLSIHSNPLLCNCAANWIRNHANNDTVFKLTLVNDIRCQNPESFRSLSIMQVPDLNETCLMPNITHHSPDIQFRVGHHALLKCSAFGDPKPMIVWKTPQGKIFKHNDYLTGAKDSKITHMDVYDLDLDSGFHFDHHWHQSEFYTHNTSHNRIIVLSNGHLFIDYVLRNDAGKYTCTAKNPLGNVTVTIDIKLNYLIIRDVTNASLIVGFCSAGVFFGLGILIGIIRFIRRKCSESAQRRKSMRNILDSLDQYKSLQLDKLDKMRDNYGNHVSKIKENCIMQMDKMRENYFTQIAKIRDNCANQMDRLRENYNNQMSRIKDYSSNQIDRIRDNYNNQMIRIRDYGANQMEKLRETYKLQHQHLIKILETMNMDNCRGIMESEMPNEQMFIDTNFSLVDGLGDKRLSHDSVSDSEFVTACSDSDGISLDLMAEDFTNPPASETVSLQEIKISSANDQDDADENNDLIPSTSRDNNETVAQTDYDVNIDGSNVSSESEDEAPTIRNQTDSDSDSSPTTSTTNPEIHRIPVRGKDSSPDQTPPPVIKVVGSGESPKKGSQPLGESIQLKTLEV